MASVPLGLDLQSVVNPRMGTGKGTQMLCKSGLASKPLSRLSILS